MEEQDLGFRLRQTNSIAALDAHDIMTHSDSPMRSNPIDDKGL